jgi:transposase-like protein
MEQSKIDQIEKVKQQILKLNKNNIHNRRRFSKRIKKNVCELVTEHNVSVKDIIKELKLANSTIRRWLSESRGSLK